jgi:sugar phosphate isomerase/epimerase
MDASRRHFLKTTSAATDGEGIRNVLIMCDGEGPLGAPKKETRTQTVNNHKKWVEAAKLLGSHSIRVNAAGSGSHEEHAKYAADGLHALSSFAKGFGINVIVEYEGGKLSETDGIRATKKLLELSFAKI